MIRYVYPCCIVLSIVLNIVLVLLLSKKFKYSKYELIFMLLVDTVGIIIGGLLYTKILTGSYGFSSLGGVLGSLLFLGIYALMLKKSYKYILILFMPSIPLMYAIGKIGCFAAGCCHGIPYDGIGHVVYHSSKVALLNTNLFPVQIVETIVFLIIFIYIISKYIKNNISIKLVMKEIIICGLAKFILDFFRYDHVDKVITSNQIMCLVLIVVSAIYLIKINKKIKG